MHEEAASKPVSSPLAAILATSPFSSRRPDPKHSTPHGGGRRPAALTAGDPLEAVGRHPVGRPPCQRGRVALDQPAGRAARQKRFITSLS